MSKKNRSRSSSSSGGDKTSVKSKPKSTPPATRETKRTKRERKQVTLLSKEYTKIYDNSNNRKSRPKPSQVVKKTKKNDATLEKEIKQLVSSTTTYQWIGPGTVGSKEEGKDNCLFFKKLEIKVGNHPALIEVGDNVLLSRGDASEADVFDKSTLNRSISDGGAEEQQVDKSDIAMNTLHPYVGKVISMWEEDIVGKDSSVVVKYKDPRRNRMKVLIQWYYNVSISVFLHR